MSDRDELAEVNSILFKYDQLPGDAFGVRGVLADLRAAGWRKKPSREELKALFVGDQALHYLAPRIADAVLALLDGSTETGGK